MCIRDRLKAAFPEQKIIAVGTNSIATSTMLKAGADMGATGEKDVYKRQLVKYAKENNFAAIVDEENKEKLKSIIRQILTDQEFTKELINNAKKTFFKNHDLNKNSLFFQDLFRDSFKF